MLEGVVVTEPGDLELLVRLPILVREGDLTTGFTFGGVVERSFSLFCSISTSFWAKLGLA